MRSQPLQKGYALQSQQGKEPSTVAEFRLGFLFLSGALWLFHATRFFAAAQGVASLELFTLASFVITFGEPCRSPIGLSITTRLALRHLQGMMRARGSS